MGTRVHYPKEIKWKAIEMKQAGYTNREIMETLGIKNKRQNWINGESKIIVPNRLNRDFTASQPNEKWVTDITYLPFGTSMLYLSTIMDLYNHEIIAYQISDRQDVQLVLKTLEMAVKERQPKQVLFHSDQGAVYTSYAFQHLA
ncbi:IS3 family transposase, partial [Aeribacillus pallidus]